LKILAFFSLFKPFFFFRKRTEVSANGEKPIGDQSGEGGYLWGERTAAERSFAFALKSGHRSFYVRFVAFVVQMPLRRTPLWKSPRSFFT